MQTQNLQSGYNSKRKIIEDFFKVNKAGGPTASPKVQVFPLSIPLSNSISIF
jgi:hypothetical protein